MINNKLKTTFFFLLASLSLQAQVITGKLVDAQSQEPLPYANVVLLQAADSTFVNGMITDENGSFAIKTPQTEQYLLRISYLGYQQLTLNVHQNDMGEIRLSPDTQLLGEVVITAVPKIHKMENGGISTDIQNSRLKNLGMVSDVLAQLPFVIRDGENFTVFGKGTPLIYVNNRLIRDLSELQEINSANIKKITVITNPGVEYDATVKSVIRIETLKPQGEGLSGSATGNMYIDKKFSHNELINLNYRKNNLDIFAMFRFSQMKDLILDDMEQITNFTEPISIRQIVTEHYNTRSIRSNLGFNYLFGKDNSVGIKYELTNNPAINALIPSETDVYRNNQPAESFASDWNNQGKRNAHYVNAYLNLNPFSWLSLKWDMDYASGDNTNSQEVWNHYAASTEYIRTDSRQDYNLWASKLMMTTPIGKGKLIYGGEYSNTRNRQDFDVNDDAPQNLSPNNNTAKQNLFAAFLSFNQTFGRFSTDVGLRYENTGFDYFVSKVKMDGQSRAYQNWFPNAGITYSDENLSTSLSYRNTINRPSYYNLRNSLQYDNPYTYETGNPYLKPSIINTLSYLFMWKDIKLLTDFDMHRDDIMTVMEQYSDETVLIRPVNLEKTSRSFSASVSYSPTFGIWKPVLETSIWRYFLEYSGNLYNSPFYSFSMRNSLMLFKDWQAGMDIMYRTAGNSQIFYIYEVFNMDVSLSKSFFDGKLRLNLRGTDLFNTAKQKTDVMINGIANKIYKDRNTRGIQLSVTYRFNATPSKYKGEAASDELKRL